MRKNASSRTMDEDLKIFLGIKPEVEEQKPAPAGMPAQEHEDVQAGMDENMSEQTGEAVQENTDGSSQVVHRVSGKQRRASLEEYKAMFLPVPSIEDRKPVFLSRDTRDALDRIVSLFGSRRMSVSGLMENIHRHSFDIKSSKVFSFLVGLGVVCGLSIWGNIELWQSKRQYADDALKFRAIRSWGGCSPKEILWLNDVFDIHRDEKSIEWVRGQADGYDKDLKTVSDSLMQESLKVRQMNGDNKK